MTTVSETEKAAREAPPTRRLRRWSPTRHTFGVLGVMIMIVLVNLTLMIQSWRRLAYRSFDSVIFDQAVRAYSRFEAPRVPLRGVYGGRGTDFLQLGDHFSPIHALLAPLYWIWDDVRVLFIAQAVMYAIAAAIIWRFTRRMLGVGMAYVVAIAFGISWGVQSAMEAGYHELDCAVPLLALIIERLYAERHRAALVATALLLLVKEEMGLVVAVVGLLFVIRGYRRWGAAVSFVGLVWFVLAVKVFVPAFGGNSQQYWSYRSLGPDPVSAAKFALSHPWKLLEIAASTDLKQQLLLWLLAVAIGAQLLSPIALLALPSLTLRLLSDTASYGNVKWQYNAPLMVILLMAGVDGIRRMAGWLSRWPEPDTSTSTSTSTSTNTTDTTSTGDTPVVRDEPANGPPARGWFPRLLVWAWAAGVLAVATYACTTPQFAYSRLSDRGAWQQSAYHRAAFDAAEQVPLGATVEADDVLGVLVSKRTQHLVLVDLKPHGSQYVLLGPPSDILWPYQDREQFLRTKQDYLDHGYEEIWQRDGVWLLRRRD